MSKNENMIFVAKVHSYVTIEVFKDYVHQGKIKLDEFTADPEEMDYAIENLDDAHKAELMDFINEELHPTPDAQKVLKEENEKLKNYLARKDDQIKKLKENKATEIEEAVKKARKEEKSAAEKALEDANKKHKQETEALKDEIADLKRQLKFSSPDSLKKAKEEAAAEIERLKGELQSEKDSHAATKKEAADMSAEIKKLTAEKAELVAKATDLETENKDLKSQLAKKASTASTSSKTSSAPATVTVSIDDDPQPVPVKDTRDKKSEKEVYLFYEGKKPISEPIAYYLCKAFPKKFKEGEFEYKYAIDLGGRIKPGDPLGIPFELADQE